MAKASATAAIKQNYGRNQHSTMKNILASPGKVIYADPAAIEKEQLYQEYYGKYKPIDDIMASAVKEVGSKKLAKDLKKFIDLLDIKLEEMKQKQQNPNQQVGGGDELEALFLPFWAIWQIIKGILYVLYLLAEAGAYTGRAVGRAADEAYRGMTLVVSETPYYQPQQQQPQNNRGMTMVSETPQPQNNRAARVARLQQSQTE